MPWFWAALIIAIHICRELQARNSPKEVTTTTRRHRCALLPADVTERLQRLCIWTPIWLLRHWAWLRWGYWRYRNLIDWLIDWFTHSIPLLHSLHWLPVGFGMDFKICLLNDKTFHERQLVYLWNMLATSLPSCLLRSHKRITLGSQGKDKCKGKGTLLSRTFPMDQPPAICPVGSHNCNLQETPETTSLWLGLSPVNASMPDGQLMSLTAYRIFAIGHWAWLH